MASNKTKPTKLTVASYLAAITDDARRKDCKALSALMAKASKLPAVMWGTAIVGFGVHHYPLAGGKTGEICAVGFSSRKGDISVYGLTGVADDATLLAKLGKVKAAKSCIYISRLADVDQALLAKLVTAAIKTKHSA